MPAFTRAPTSTSADFGRQRLRYPIEQRRADFYYGDAGDLPRPPTMVIPALETHPGPGQRVVRRPADLRKTPYSDAYLYYMFPELRPATYYIEMDPGMANRPDSGLASEVATADWLILSDIWDDWSEPNDSPQVRLRRGRTRRSAKHFCLVGAYGRGGPPRASSSSTDAAADPTARPAGLLPALRSYRRSGNVPPMRILVVVPTYQEAENIEPFLDGGP